MLYRRWIDELWAGRAPAAEFVSAQFVGHWPGHDVHGPDGLQGMITATHEMVSDLTFAIEIEPLVDDDLLAARWVGRGNTDQGPTVFYGNDILRIDGERFVEYWTGTSTA